jgi:hypothetical protein
VEREQWLEDKSSVARQVRHRKRSCVVRDRHGGKGPSSDTVENELATRRDCDEVKACAYRGAKHSLMGATVHYED